MKQMKHFLILAVLLMAGQCTWAQDTPTFSGGSGSAADPYKISTVADLNALAEAVNGGNDYGEKYFKLTADLDYSVDDNEDGTPDYAFTPIGYDDEDDSKYFKGIFDGYNHTIKGITVNTPNAEGVGLFGCIHLPAIIKNIKLENSSFVGSYGVGAIVGSSKGSADKIEWGIYNCTVASNVSLKAVESKEGEGDGMTVGGIVGYQVGMTVKNCISAAKVEGDSYIGGISGLLEGHYDAFFDYRHYGVIEDCFYTGSSTFEGEGYGKIVGDRGLLDDDDKILPGTDGLIRLTLLNDDSSAEVKNTDRVRCYDGLVVDSLTLADRTLFKNKRWNTLCLPFALTYEQIAASCLKDAKFTTLLSNTFDEGTGGLTLTFKEGVTGIDANTAYLIKWEEGTNITNPSFENVTIVSPTATTDGGRVSFVGTLSPVTFTAENRSVLYLAGDNKLYYPNRAMTIGACRAYFKLKGLTAGDTETAGDDDESLTVSSFVLNFGDASESDGQTTGIETVTPSLVQGKGVQHVYNLSGQRVANPAKGLYIVNGKKVVF